MKDAPKKKTVSLELVTKLQQEVDEMPLYEPTHVSKQKAIAMMAPAIASMRAKKYPWKEIAARLTENGVPVSVAALRTYLRRISAVVHDKKRNKTRTTSR
jgi:hypothetical protein